MNLNTKKLILIMSFLTTFFGASAQNAFTNANVAEFNNILKTDSVQLLDVRTQEEYAEAHIAKAINIDVLQPDFLSKATAKLNSKNTVAVYCRSGKRSAAAAAMLAAKGYKVVNLKGGIMAWTESGKETER